MVAGPNPLVALGNLNRLRGTILFPDNPSLNITAPYLGKEGIKLGFEGDFADMLGQMAGSVISENVYVMANLTVALIKTQSLAAAFKSKFEVSSILGPCTFRSDAANLPPFDFANCAIEAVDGVDASGTSALFGIRIKGTYYINSELWNL